MTDLQQEILRLTSARAITGTETVQTLWSGYGELVRVQLAGASFPSVIVKHIQLPEEQAHPRGWNTPQSHKRKQTSYQVETCWYQRYAAMTTEDCRVPRALKVMNKTAEILIIMEDLNASGYEGRLTPDTVTVSDARVCLSWLAHFHARFLRLSCDGLWPVGTYWHLDTRPEELKRMTNQSLRSKAKAIDQQLNNARFQTFVHGDAKLANFCFSRDGKVAAVDFQYVGKGCGMKDVAYFISSCFDENESERHEEALLLHYFGQLEMAVSNTIDFKQLKSEWMNLYKYASADFYRFLDGWSPGHWKMHRYSEKLTNEVLDQINAQEC